MTSLISDMIGYLSPSAISVPTPPQSTIELTDPWAKNDNAAKIYSNTAASLSSAASNSSMSSSSAAIASSSSAASSSSSCLISGFSASESSSSIRKEPSFVRPPSDSDQKTIERSANSFLLSDGSVYTGQILNGRAHGKGSLVWENGNTYVGEFVDGIKEGYGTMIYNQGRSRYEGMFKNNLFHGIGKFSTRENNKNSKCDTYEYKGAFENGVRSGQGAFVRIRIIGNETMTTTGTGTFLKDHMIAGKIKDEFSDPSIKKDENESEGYFSALISQIKNLFDF